MNNLNQFGMVRLTCYQIGVYMHRFLCVLLILLATTSCTRHYQREYDPSITDDGLDRPKIVLIPVFDSSNPNVNWNVSYELTRSILDKLACDNNLFVYKEIHTFNYVLRKGHMSLEDTMDSIRPLFGRSDFVILLELQQHDVLPYERESNPELVKQEWFTCNTTLQQRLRMVVLDVRCRPAKFILEETICNNQTIPKAWEFYSPNLTPWGSDAYDTSPVGCAHHRLAQVAADYIETVVWSLK